MNDKIKNYLVKGKIFFAHFSFIKNDPIKFLIWLFSSVIISLSSVWIPLLLGSIFEIEVSEKIRTSNPFVFFSIVFLSNAMLTAINIVGAGSNNVSMGIRGISLILNICYLLFLTTIIPFHLFLNKTLSWNGQLSILAFTILVGIYFYGFRDISWEKGVEEISNLQEEKINTIIESAEQLQNDGGSVKL
ncbi:hypothetical protein EHQ96_00245 [Leptospira levettii]|uniref:hypothetical protein n=1 Tax=Leptospira levettii TaxID=2023178 RepID=UPI001083AC86|nr:hypothetical protein [Leptospira levettii]TGM73565.1 hypothetical protein EHQ96_00245 [Leptospira levettii]